METKNRTSMNTLTNLYDWHTKLFINVINGISDKDAQNRLNTKANHIAWIAGSLVHGRYELGKFFGIGIKQTSHDLFKDYKGIQENVAYPPLDEFRKDWENINQVLKDSLVNASGEQLNGPDPFKMPGGPFTFFDTIVACIDRESYCIGQIGLWRRLLGYEPMKYM
ncbi:MAG: DinB family protein [Bacteroidota bacterium]|nr:DinB family protein [Bacteroidota bacterium]